MIYKKPPQLFYGLLILFFFSWPLSSPCEEAKVVIVKPSVNAPVFAQIIKGFYRFFESHPGAASISEEIFTGDNRIFNNTGAVNPRVIFAIGKDQILTSLKNTENIPVVGSELVRKNKTVEENKRLAIVSLSIEPLLRLQFVKKALPRAQKIGIIYEPQQNSETIDEYGSAAGALGLSITKFSVTTIKEINSVEYGNMDVLLLIPDTFVCQALVLKNIILSSFQCKVPVVGISQAYAQAGTILATEPDYEDNGAQAGGAALRIINGEKPADIPMAFCRKLKHYVNKAMAKRLAIEISKDIENDASFVFGE